MSPRSGASCEGIPWARVTWYCIHTHTHTHECRLTARASECGEGIRLRTDALSKPFNQHFQNVNHNIRVKDPVRSQGNFVNGSMYVTRTFKMSKVLAIDRVAQFETWGIFIENGIAYSYFQNTKIYAGPGEKLWLWLHIFIFFFYLEIYSTMS